MTSRRRAASSPVCQATIAGSSCTASKASLMISGPAPGCLAPFDRIWRKRLAPAVQETARLYGRRDQPATMGLWAASRGRTAPAVQSQFRPVHSRFESRRDPIDFGLLPIISDQHHADWQTVGHGAGNRHCRMTRDVEGTGVSDHLPGSPACSPPCARRHRRQARNCRDQSLRAICLCEDRQGHDQYRRYSPSPEHGAGARVPSSPAMTCKRAALSRTLALIGPV